MNKVIDDKKFTHCLRAQIFPDKNADQRIKSLVDFCVQYGFDNIILMFNGECFNIGHITNDELKPWIDVIKKAKVEFAKHNISTSINPWFEIGHLDRGRKLRKDQNFQNMVDFNGKSTELVVCPLDEKWQEYYLNQMAYYVKEIEPDTLWIEDDFRLHNHEPLEWGGCFCPLHMKKYQEKLGYPISRENLKKKILEGPSKERDAFLEVSFETMDELAKKISNKVKSLNLNTSIALMSSMPEMHAVENRNWNKLLNDLSSDGNKIDRIHLPCYIEISPKKYIYEFNRNSMVVRSFIGDDTFIYPELENSAFSSFAKSPRFLKFQVESAIPLGLSGMTYDIFDFCGNGAQNEFGYGPVLKELTPYLSKIKELDLNPSELTGIVIPIDEKTVKNRETTSTWKSIIPDDYDCISYFSTFGYSFELSKEKQFKNKTIILAGQVINNFSNEELINLFRNNFVIIDGYAGAKLFERKLNYLIKAKSYKKAICNDGQTSFEVSLEKLNDIDDYKKVSEKENTDPYSFEFDEDVEIKSVLYKFDGTIFGNGLAISNNFMILPFEVKGIPQEQFGLFRVFQFNSYDHLLKGSFVKSINQCVYTYLFDKKDFKVLILTNANTDIFDSFCFDYYGFEINKISIVKKDGTIKDINFRKQNNRIYIDEKLDYMSTMTMILK